MAPFAAVAVLVFVAGGDEASDRSLERALQDALGRDARVTVRSAGEEDDREVLAQAAAAHATVAAVVTWGEGQRRVTLRFVRVADAAWGDREIHFRAADPTRERGRTVGFALAAAVPTEPSAKEEATPTEPVAPRASTSTEAAPTDDVPTMRASERPRQPPLPWAQRRNALEMLAQGSTAVSGEGGGFGGEVGVRLGLSPALRLRFAVGGRFGVIPAAQATSRFYKGSAGIAWETGLEPAHRWSFGARVEALALAQEVIHLSEDDPEPDHRLRLLPGGAAALELSFRFVEYASVVLGLGSEIAFGVTDIVVRGRTVAEVVPVVPFGALGFRLYF